MDCFKAHCTAAVRKFAKEHYIELIFVPANGTSEYQPLDRRIFGILKSKLRSLAGSRIFAGSQRFEMIAKDLVNSWAEISQENLQSAWNIPKLDELVQRIDRGEAIDEDNLDLDLLDFLQIEEDEELEEEEEEWESDVDDLNYRDY